MMPFSTVFRVFKSERLFANNFKWLVAIVAMLVTVASIPGQTAGVSAFTDYLIKAYGVSRTQLSFSYMVGTIASGFLLPAAGKLLDRIGSRKMVVFAGLGLAFSLWLLAVGPEFLGYLPENSLYGMVLAGLAFFGIRHFGQGQFVMVSRTVMGVWFKENLGRVTGIMGVLVAFAFGVAPLALTSLIDSSGWQGGMILLMAVAILAGALGAAVFFDPRQKVAQKAKSKAFGQLKEDQKKVIRELKKERVFWLYNLGLTFQGAVITALTFHFTGIASELSIPKIEAYKIFLPIAFVSVISHLVSGYLADKKPLHGQLLVMLATLSCATFMTQFIGETWGFYGVAGFFGISGGIHSCLMVVAWPKIFGTKDLGAISGYNLGWVVIGTAVGPYFVSLIHNIGPSLHGSFGYLALFPLVLFFLAIKKDKKYAGS